MNDFDVETLSDPSVLSAGDLFYVHLDERLTSVTLGFTTQEGSEGFEFFLVFTDVRQVTVRGWGPPGLKKVELVRSTDGIAVVVKDEHSLLSFRAAEMALGRTRTFQASSQSI
ncbi:hypothetical protein [Streptomyces sp. NPDC046939]|uniref:hypothetical protein n=1 Tax=Streptomyces sp. NPDC046939 TaxID=3155376 RepID=UPI0033F5EDA9